MLFRAPAALARAPSLKLLFGATNVCGSVGPGPLANEGPGEAEDAYVFVTRDQFQKRIADNGFLEWTEFIGNMYGTPNPEAPSGRDIVLEIEVDGASQVKKMHPDAMLLFVLPPTREEQRARLQGRGDVEQKVEQRLRKAEDEEPIGKALADFVLINDDLNATIDEMLELINAARAKHA